MQVDQWSEFTQSVLATSVALALILLLRKPLRRALGARTAYAAWALVPLCLIAVLIPAPSSGLAFLADAATQIGLLQGLPASTPAAGSVDLRTLLASLWIAGALTSAAVFARRQSQFNRLVQASPGLPYDHVLGHGPAVTGLLRPRVVLPADFQQRYSAEEQTLVLAHERLHLERGDIIAQGLATALRCVFWFNPLAHYAAAAFRFDQELACDADVLARHPDSRRAYGEAMLKTQLADFGLPVGCHWQSSHPLKERISMLRKPLPGAVRRRTGLIVVAALVVSGSYAAWAAQPGQSGSVPAIPGISSITAADVMTPPRWPDGVSMNSTGMVVLDLLVGSDGKVQQVKVHSSKPAGIFDAAAIEAASQWRFNAARDSLGKKVQGWVRVPVQFAPDEPPASPPAG